MSEEKKGEIRVIVTRYIEEIKKILGSDFQRAVVYGSFARGDMQDESDVDIAIFTNRSSQEFYLLIDKISELTFEFNVHHDIVLSPVFQNTDDYARLLHVLPFYQNIQKEGVVIG